jgi:hypothetical protein
MNIDTIKWMKIPSNDYIATLKSMMSVQEKGLKIDASNSYIQNKIYTHTTPVISHYKS